MSSGQYVATRPFPTAHRQYEIGDTIDTSRITSSELNAGVMSGAIEPAKFIDTAARLVALNPVMGPGVHAYETDTGVHKIGTDGITRYNSLGQVGNGTYAGWDGSGLTQAAAPVGVPVIRGLHPHMDIVAQRSGLNPTFNFDGIPESIVKVGNVYWCCYLNTSGTRAVRLAYAASPDGPWTDYSGSPVLTVGDQAWESSQSSPTMSSPHLMQGPDGTFYIWYTCEANGLGTGAIGFATASVVTGPYTKYASNPVLNTIPSSWESRRVTEPSVVYDSVNSRWVMAYMAETLTVSAGLSEQIGIATAPAPEGPWTRHPGNPVVPQVNKTDWDGYLTADPSLFKAGGYWWMHYSGGANDDGTGTTPWSIGLAYATDPLGTWTKYYGNPILRYGGNTAWDDGTTWRGSTYVENGVFYVVYGGRNGPGASTTKGGNARLVQRLPQAAAIAYSGSPSSAVSCTTAMWTQVSLATVMLGGGMQTGETPNLAIVPESGRYRVSAHVGFDVSGAGDRAMQVRKNAAGSATGGTRILLAAGGNTGSTPGAGVSASRIVTLARGDTLELFAYQDSGSSLDVQAGADLTSLDVDYLGASAPAGGGTVVVMDQFDRADGTLGTTTSGGTWSALSGTWAVAGSLASGIGASGGIAVVDSGVADCTVEATIVSGTTDGFGLCFRAASATEYIMIRDTGDVYKISAGGNGSLGTIGAYASGDRIGVILSGSTIQATRNGKPCGKPITSTFNQSATKHGLRTHSATPQTFDDFVVRV